MQLTASANAFAERWVRSVKSECLSHFILFGEGSLRRCGPQKELRFENQHDTGNRQRCYVDVTGWEVCRCNGDRVAA